MLRAVIHHVMVASVGTNVGEEKHERLVGIIGTVLGPRDLRGTTIEA